MNKQEWLSRCAARYVEKAIVTQAEADCFAQVCYDSQEYDEGFSELANYNPESCADEDMEEWVRHT